MAKQRSTQTGTRKDDRRTALTVPQFDLDEWVGKYIWLIIPLLVVLYYLFSTGSTGFYQDDEIGHYRNIRQFWQEPFSIMGNQPKPGWKILMVLPSIFGIPGVALAHCLMAALTVVATWYLGRAMKIRNSIVAAVLLAAQPLYLQLSFRTYSEITAGLFVVLMLLFYVRKQYLLSAVFSSYIFSIRQEFALVSIIMGVVFLYRKQWLPFIMLAWTPVVLGIIGWAVTHNPMWLLDDMRKIGLGVEVPHKPFWHYFETYIYMVGPVGLGLLVVGYWSFINAGAKWKDAIVQEGFVFFTYTVMWAWAVFSAWDLPNFGANPGHWRYMLSIAPLTAIYSAKGLNVLFSDKGKKYGMIMLGLFLFIVLVFLSKETNGLITTDKASYVNFTGAALMFLIVLLAVNLKALKGRAATVALLVLAVGFTMYAEKPRKLDREAETVHQSVEWYLSQQLKDRPLYCNHVLFSYFAGIDVSDKSRGMYMSDSTIKIAPKGSLVVWDSHYGNSQFGGDVAYERIQKDSSFTLLKDFLSADQRFYIGVYEKNR
jgi:hypothetical protein